jgi:hypothetical protein
MNVRAKFKVVSVTHFENDQAQIKLAAIHGNDNRSWSKWTPSGDLTMSCTNPEATKQFIVGSCVFLDFSEAPAKESDEIK